MSTDNLSELSMSISQISDERGYWFFRSQGGAYYSDFFKYNFIGIGYNEISIKDLTFADEKTVSTHIKSKLSISGKADKSGYAASHMIRFVHGLKKGDVVIVPDHASRRVVYGIITSDSPYMKSKNSEDKCPFQKRWDVNWTYQEARHRLNPKLFPIFSSRHIITDISKYAPYIDSTISDLYIKDEKVHFVINILTDNPILRNDFDTFCNYTSFFIDDFERYFGGIPDEEQEIKIGLQSRGRVEIISKTFKGILGFGILVNAVVGGNFEVGAWGLDFKMTNPGILKTWDEYRNSSADRQQKIQVFQKVLKKMDVDTIRDVDKLLEFYKANTKEKNDTIQ